ncbi:unnamed protein product, partial [Pleuronectes platessa]
MDNYFKNSCERVRNICKVSWNSSNCVSNTATQQHTIEHPIAIAAQFRSVTGGRDAWHVLIWSPAYHRAKRDRDKQPFTLTYTTTVNFQSPMNLAPNLHVFGLWEEAG